LCRKEHKKEYRLKVLLVYPQYPDTFWSFKHALKFIFKKATFPPLGLLTVAAMLPEGCEKKLVDMNTTALTDKDLKWGDYVFISGMVVQQKSAREVVERCKKWGITTVAGGPFFSRGYEESWFDDIDHLVFGEAEDILPQVLDDLEKGCAKHIYAPEERPDIRETPIPVWSLVPQRKYQSMTVQYSRGCPFNCEFCDIVTLYGHKPRTKDRGQIVAELDALYDAGWRGSVFFVDDNFIGNKRKLKSEILPAIIEWVEEKKRPFSFFTEASINLADDEELMNLMTRAGFDMVFVGIESPNEESLLECNKLQNKGRDLLAAVKRIHNHGMQVQGGFIVGFDSDPVSIFKSQIDFIQKSGIVTAMVGVLMAPPETRLYKRLKKENRLLVGGTGDNTDGSTNFIPKMGRETLARGYKHVIDTIYAPRQYYERIKTFLKEYRAINRGKTKVSVRNLIALVRSTWVLGVKEKGRTHYWRLVAWILLKKPKTFPLFMTLAVEGFHFREVAKKLRVSLASDIRRLEQGRRPAARDSSPG
jgi:radical SAM superfamily enzyme YgiQ (UPF0313 family)